MIEGKKAIFSFQIAHHSVVLRELIGAPWPGGIFIDSLDDLIASKMGKKILNLFSPIPSDNNRFVNTCPFGSENDPVNQDRT